MFFPPFFNGAETLLMPLLRPFMASFNLPNLPEDRNLSVQSSPFTSQRQFEPISSSLPSSATGFYTAPPVIILLLNQRQAMKVHLSGKHWLLITFTQDLDASRPKS